MKSAAHDIATSDIGDLGKYLKVIAQRISL
jgi:hypothetical protein